MRILLTFLSVLFLSISYSQGPTADFSASPLSVCLGSPITFTDLSTPGSATITSWAWDFGDGNSSTSQNPTHVYTNPGTYTIILVATDQNSVADPEVKAGYVTVSAPPNASFTTSGNGCTVPFGVTFTNTSTTGASITYAWDFGNTESSNAQNPPLVNYTSEGSYNVSLIVVNTSTGCSDTTEQLFVVSDYAADIIGDDSVCVGVPITFTDNSTIGANSWTWSSGSGPVSTIQNPTFTYAAAGNYTVNLNSQNTLSGCSDNASFDIVVLPAPSPSFTASPVTGCAPLTSTFTNTSVGGIDYSWDFGNGNTSDLENPGVNIYAANGSYSVSLTMTDQFGCTASSVNTNMIVVSDAVADFSADVLNGCDPLSVQFSDESTVPDPSGDPITTWDWDFGDGNTFSGENPPINIYPVGVYDVTLTINTANGCSATLTESSFIEVGAIDLVDYSHAPLIECAKSNIDFTDLSVISAPHDPSEVTYAWDFGDGGTSTEQNPSYAYPTDTGYFDVQFIVDFRGCKDTLIKTDAVYIKAPISKFSPEQTLYCNESLPVTVNVTDESIIGQSTDDVLMVWKWGDPLNSTTTYDDPDLDPDDDGSSSFVFSDYGTYTIEQVIYNYTTGCEDSTTATIHISETVASFVMDNDSICKNSELVLTSTSTSSHPFGTYNYDMGNGGTSSGLPANYTYTTAGSYDITLTATNNVGCAHTSTFTGFDVLELPLAVIDPSATNGCAPINVVYTNNSVPQGNGFSTFDNFFWVFPDASNQTTTNLATATSFTFNAAGNFTTTLVATDGFGCVSAPASVFMSITKPDAMFVIDTVACNEVPVIATNSTTGATSYEWYVDNVGASTATDLNYTFSDVSNPSYSYIEHEVELIAIDINGCKDTATALIKISLPYADLTYTLSGANVNSNGEFTCPPVFATFTDESNVYGGVNTYAWDFGDTKFSSQENPTNTYVFAGTYTASLTITDQFGCTADTVLVDYLTIGGPEGEGSWTLVGDICQQAFQFDTTNMVDVDHFVFDLGNGVEAHDSTFLYGYPNSGLFVPTFTIYDALGCEVIYEMSPILVNNSDLNAEFTSDVTENEIGVPFLFTDQSIAGSSAILQWNWSLGDYGNTEITNFSNQSLGFAYYQPGYYTVELGIVDGNGCVDTFSLNVHVSGDIELPNVFTPNNDGINDAFTLKYDYFETFDIIILNRWGNVISERLNATGQTLWDGLDMNGNACTEGVYFYKFNGKMKDGSMIAKDGFVTKI
jgi:gliding motility-associated-like protein